MDEQQAPTTHARRPSGRDAKRASRAARAASSIPYITRKIPYYEVLGEEGLSLIENERRHHSRGDRHRLPRRSRGARDLESSGRRRERRARAFRARHVPLARANEPRRAKFTQHARNPARSVVIGGKNTVFAPAYGSPFVRNLDEGRRYARIEDFRNFVKLAYMSHLAPSLGRHDLRARRSAGQQAPPRHGVQPPEIQRQGVHGIGDRARARRRFGRPGEHRVRLRARPIPRPAARRPPSSVSSTSIRR